MGERVFLLNQVKVNKLSKPAHQAAPAEGVRLLLTKWAPQLRGAGLCHVPWERMGAGSPHTPSLRNSTSISAGRMVLFAILQYTVQIPPK